MKKWDPLALLIATALINAPQIAGATQQTDEAPIRLSRALSAGAVLGVDDLVVTDAYSAAAASTKDALIGMSLRRMMAENAPITARDVRAPILVDRNSIVKIEFVKGPLSIIAEGRALSAGGRGDIIRVMNTNTKVTLSAIVLGEARVATP